MSNLSVAIGGRLPCERSLIYIRNIGVRRAGTELQFVNYPETCGLGNIELAANQLVSRHFRPIIHFGGFAKDTRTLATVELRAAA